MLSEQINLKYKPGVEELAHQGSYAVIANRELYDHGKAHKFAVVDKEMERLDDVCLSPEQARAEMRSLS
jgi:hypothetical protein